MEAKEKYIEFCKQEEHLPIFFQPWYLDGVCPKANWNATVGERDGKVVGIFPYYKKLKGPYNYISMPPNSRMMGPYVTFEFRGEGYSKIVKAMTKALPKVEFFYQSFHYAVTDWLSFYSANFTGKKLYTFILHDFKDLPKTYSNFNRSIREKAIPKAQKLVKIKKGLDPKHFYEMFVRNKQSLNKDVEFDYTAFKSHHDSLINNKAGCIYYTEDENEKVHSAALLMWDKLSSYFYLTAEEPEFKFSNSLSLLTWHCIEVTSKELNLDYFDFGGSQVEAAENVNHPFNAVQVPFLNLSHYDSKKFGPFKSINKRRKKKRG